MKSTSLSKSDIVHIVNYSWEKTFGCVDSNKKVICDTGWNPLNYALLNSQDPHSNSNHTIETTHKNTQNKKTF